MLTMEMYIKQYTRINSYDNIYLLQIKLIICLNN